MKGILNMKKDFKVIDFVNEYKKQVSESDKIKFLKTKLKVESYLSYSEKLVTAELIVKNSSYAIVKNEENGALIKTNRIKINSPMRYILFVMNVVNKYTNLEVNFKDVLPEYDALNKNGLIEVVFAKIGDKEVGEFNTVIDMVLNDFMTNEYEFKNFVSEKLSQINEMIKKVAPHIDNIVNKLDNLTEEDANKLSKVFEKIGKFIK